MKRLLAALLLSAAVSVHAYAGGSSPPGIVQSGGVTPGHCYQIGSSGVAVDAGAACGTGTAGVTQSTGTPSQVLVNGDTLAHTGPTTYSLPPALTLGVPAASTGSLGLAGATSGMVTIQPQAAAGTFNFNLPTTAGAAGQLFTSGGGGTTAGAWTSTGASGHALPFLDGTNTWAGAQTFSLAPTLGGITGLTQCLHVNTAGLISGTGADCGAGGGGGTPGGVSGQVQFNNAGVFGGFSVSGDGTLNTGTGALSITKTGGVAFAASATTDTTNAANISSGTLPAGRMPALTGDVTTSAGTVADTIVANAVTYAKFQQTPALSLVGNPTGVTANTQTVSLGQGLTFCGTSVCPTAPDNTSTVNYTVTASDMAGLRTMNGSNLTLTVPAISSTIFAQGMTAVFDNTNATALSITSTPVINGLPSASAMHQFGFAGCASNGTSLDCFGFPGFGTITSNALPKFIDATGATTASAINDNGTIVRSSEPISVQTNQSFVTEITNAGTTGTTLNKLAKLSSGNAIIASTTDTDGEIGVVIGGAGTAGAAQIAFGGTAACVFDGATTAGDFVGISSSVAGDCHDTGASRPLSSQSIGRVLTTNGAGGTFGLSLALGLTNTAGGGSGTVNAGTAGQMAYYATSTAAVSGNANATISGGALSLGQAGSGGSLALSGATSGSGTVRVAAAAGSGTIFQLPTTNGTSGNPLITDGSGNTSWQPNVTFGSGVLNLGASGTAGSAVLGNATSGTVTIQPVTGALGSATASLPANTGTIAELNLAQSWTAGQAVTPTTGGTQSPAGTFTPDFSLSNSVTLTFGAGNLTIANPTNVKAGQSYVIALTQDATGSRTVTWGTEYKWAGGTAPTLTTTASAKDIISCWSDTTTTLNCTLAVKDSR